MPLKQLFAFSRARRGNVAMIFGLAAVPLLGMVGAAVDFGMATSAKTQLDTALDSATLLATTAASNAVSGGASVASAISSAQSMATARFKAQMAGLSSANLKSVTAVVTTSGTAFSASMSYSASYSTGILDMFNLGNIPLSGSSSTTLATAPYADISVMIDVSGSMAIGATVTDMNNIGALTNSYNPGNAPSSTALTEIMAQNKNCAFACHWTTSYPDYYTLAEQQGITLRIDVVRSAVSNLISTLSGLNTNRQFRLALYTFNTAATNIYPLSSNISSATAALPQVALDTNDCVDGPSPCSETNFPASMATVTSAVGTAGDGTTQAAPKKYLVIVTDGVVDYFLGGQLTEYAAGGSACAQAKANGVTVMVLYTTYIQLTGALDDPRYDLQVAPFQSTIWPTLQACASQPSLAWQATDQAGITAALQQMLVIATTSPGHFGQ